VLAAPVLAAILVTIGRVLGWRGVDVAAQVHRIDAIRSSGFGLWDPQWYGGHWTLDYSVLYPLLASLVGVAVMTVLSAAGAALAFDRLARPHFAGGAGVAASLLFAAGTVVQSSIGQLPFLTGEAFGLAACWGFSRRHTAVAALLALATSLCSPLAGGFVALALTAWALSRWRPGDRLAGLVPAAVVVVAAVGPVVATAVLFPGQGNMPYPAVDWAWEMVVAAGIWLAAGRTEPAIRLGAMLFMAAATFAVAVPTPLGGNIGRLEDILAVPLAVALLWTRWRVVLPVALVPLVLSQWSPAWTAITTDPGQPSTHRAFFTPLDAALRGFSAAGPAGRVEVVPTKFHWEAAYVAPVMALARGWERQLDVSDNPIFYRSDELAPASYRSWLLNNGVRFVALANAPLDMAGQSEGRLVASGTVPGLRLIWQSAGWRLYSVAGSQGIVQGPAVLVRASGDQVVVAARAAGSVLVREHFTSDWSLSKGAGCISRSPASWISVDVPGPEVFTLDVSLFASSQPRCAVVAASAGGRSDAGAHISEATRNPMWPVVRSIPS
jgi:hypothetical protein